jgi:hypothetical protein
LNEQSGRPSASAVARKKKIALSMNALSASEKAVSPASVVIEHRHGRLACGGRR